MAIEYPTVDDAVRTFVQAGAALAEASELRAFGVGATTENDGLIAIVLAAVGATHEEAIDRLEDTLRQMRTQRGTH